MYRTLQFCFRSTSRDGQGSCSQFQQQFVLSSPHHLSLSRFIIDSSFLNKLRKMEEEQANNQQKKIKMPSFFSCASKAFRSVDLFPSSKFMRYNGETEYTSTTGGVISVAVFAIFIILFSNMGLKTLKKQIIEAESKTTMEVEPPELTFKTGPEGDVMFGIFLFGQHLNVGPRLFDFHLYEQEYGPKLVFMNSTEVPLVPCTEQHFGFTDELRTQYHKLHITMALCPPLNHQFKIKGKMTSDSYHRLRVVANRCNSTLDPTCANDSAFAAAEAGRFQMVIPFIQNSINAQSQKYKEFFLDDKSIFSFSGQLGVCASAEIQEDIIETDMSLLPYEDKTIEKVIRKPKNAELSYYLKTSNLPNLEIVFKKSSETVTYKRGFNKIDTYFSYVGGLVGTIIGLIFIMGPYTQKTYEISLAKKVLLDNQKKQISSQSFNVFYLFLIYIKKFLELFKCNPDWPKVQTYIEASEEVSMQVDTTYLVRKMMFLDVAVSKLMEKYEVDSLYMRDKPTIESAKNQRIMHFAPELFKLKHEGKGEDQNHFAQGKFCPNQVLFGESIGVTSPNNLRPPTTGKEEQKQEQDDDVSAIEMSENGDKVEEIKASLAKMVLESMMGKTKSKSIIDEIHPKTLRQIGILDNMTEQRTQTKHVSIAEIESIQNSDIFLDDKNSSLFRSSQKKKSKGK